MCMTFSNCKGKEQSCQSQLYNVDTINTLCRHNNKTYIMTSKSYIMTSKIRYDINKYFITSKSSSWRQKVCCGQKVRQYIKKFVITSKYVTKSKSASWCQQYLVTSEITPWRQKVRLDVNNTSWRQSICQKSSSWRQKVKGTMLCHIKVIADRRIDTHRQPQYNGFATASRLN